MWLVHRVGAASAPPFTGLVSHSSLAGLLGPSEELRQQQSLICTSAALGV